MILRTLPAMEESMMKIKRVINLEVLAKKVSLTINLLQWNLSWNLLKYIISFWKKYILTFHSGYLGQKLLNFSIAW